MDIKILVVDESVQIHKIVATALGTQSTNIETATQSEEAMNKLESAKPHIVLANTDIPGLSGYELSNQIKQSAQFNNTPVLLLIGNRSSFDQEKFNNSKADDYLTKPFKSDDLAKKVKQLLASEDADASSAPTENLSPTEQSEEAPDPGDSMIEMDNMMNDIIGESGLSTDKFGEVDGSGTELISTEDPLDGMDDIMSDIIDNSGAEGEANQSPKPSGGDKPLPPGKNTTAPIKLSLTQKIETKTTPTGELTSLEPSPTPPLATNDDSNENKLIGTENKNEEISLEEMLKSAEASLEDDSLERLAEKTLKAEKDPVSEEDIEAKSKSKNEPQVSTTSTEETQPVSPETAVPVAESAQEEISMTPDQKPANIDLNSTSPSLNQPASEESSLAEVDNTMDSSDALDSIFETIQHSESKEKIIEDPSLDNERLTEGDTRAAFAEDMAQLEIKPEPEDLLERLAPSAFTASGTSGKPDLVKETLSYLSELSPKKSESIAAERKIKNKKTKRTSKFSQPVKQKEISMRTEKKGDLFVQIVGEHIKRILERSLEESIAKEISGLSSTIERSVREIVKEVTPEIARSIIQEEIEKIRKMEKV